MGFSLCVIRRMMINRLQQETFDYKYIYSLLTCAENSIQCTHTLIMLCFVLDIWTGVVVSHDVWAHVFKVTFNSTRLHVWFPQCQWGNPEGNGWDQPAFKHHKTRAFYIILGMHSVWWTWCPEIPDQTGHENCFALVLKIICQVHIVSSHTVWWL